MRFLFGMIWILLAPALVAQTLRERQEADHWQAEAEEAQAQRQYDRVVQLLSRVIALDPGRYETYLLRAQNKERTEAWRTALIDYNIYLEWQPAHFEARWLRAMLLYRLKDWNAAAADLKTLLRLPAGETTHVVFELAPHGGGVQRAFTTHQGNKPQIFNALGMIHAETAEYPLALAYFDSALQVAPRYPEALANRGLVNEKLGRTEQAQADLKMALHWKPDLEVAAYNLAVTHRASVSEEESHLTHLIDQQPLIPYPYYERATLYLEQKKYTAAMADIKAAIRIDSLNETYWVTSGIIHEKLQQWRAALRDYTRAIQVNETWAEAWFHHGNAARQLNDRATAVEDYSMAIFLRSDYGNAFYNRAIVHYEMRNLRHACADLKEAERLGVKIDPRLKQKVCVK
jgi:tetratricopeptide (TPR) repeat protein